MPRKYRQIKQYEKEILELKEKGLTKREIGEKLGFAKNKLVLSSIFKLIPQPTDKRFITKVPNPMSAVCIATLRGSDFFEKSQAFAKV